MAKVNVVIVDATGNKEQKVGLPDDIKCGIIMVKLVEKRSVQYLAVKLPQDGNQHRLQCNKQKEVQAAQHIKRQQTFVFIHSY